MANHIAVTQRVSLQWPPQSPFEQADVLTFELGKYFMDLRVFTTGPNKGTIDWSMAGVRQVLDGSTPDVTKIRFLNIIDSRDLHSEQSPALDESRINALESAHPLDLTTQDDVKISPLTKDTFREYGNMPNPDSDSDVYVPFEEVWKNVTPSGDFDAVLLETIGGDGKGKAYIGRVGGRELALADPEDGGEYLARRDELVDGQWKEVYSFGKVREVLPRLPEANDWKTGDVVQYAGRKWVVRFRR